RRRRRVRRCGRRCCAGAGAGAGDGTGTPVPVEQAAIVGGDTIDPVTAAQLFVDTPAFRRVITDPIQGITVTMDRRTYRPTTAQRDWLILTHGTCSRDGCHRLAVDTDIDHDTPWATGGTTDQENLRPLCPRDHTHRHRTRANFHTRPDRTTQVTTPTGHTTQPTNRWEPDKRQPDRREPGGYEPDRCEPDRCEPAECVDADPSINTDDDTPAPF
ncbi:MAG: HNH endonuclease signature motif containing protein, partial [Microbacterium sp.]